MNFSLHTFSDWLANTPMSMVIQDVTWIIPTVQTIHILSIAIVMSSVFMIDLRLIGVISLGQPMVSVARRFLPWVWCALVVLLVTGSTLVIGEPGRSLDNPVFRLKIAMIITVALLTLIMQRGLRRDSQFWEQSPGRRAGAKLLAVVSLLLWISIVFAGRWIAYITSDTA